MTELCPNCGHLEAYSEEKQLRSADEGSTILYTVSLWRQLGESINELDFRSVSSANTDGGSTTSLSDISYVWTARPHVCVPVQRGKGQGPHIHDS